MPRYVVLMGPPGAGKGTQAARIGQALGLAHVSSGDLFRDNIKRGTPLSQQVKTILDRGDLVPDDVTIAMVKDRLGWPDAAAGAVLDGFPRTPGQAGALEIMLAEMGGKVNVALSVEVPEEIAVERMAGRRTCRARGHIYNEKTNPPRRPGVCDVDGSELYQRDDQKEQAVRQRNQVYLRETAPLIDYYRTSGQWKAIDGTREIGAVTADLLAAIGAAGAA